MSFGAVVLLGLAAATVFGPAGESLVWVAPSPACPSPREVEERLARLLGGEASAVRAQARVQAHASGWRVDLTLRWQGHDDVRTIVADSCDTLADATVLLVAVTADPVMVLRHAQVETPSPEGDPPADPRPRVVTPVPVALDEGTSPAPVPASTGGRRRARDRGPVVGVSGVLDLGSLPRLTAGLGATVGWRWSRARLFAEGSYLPPRAVISDAPYARQGRVQLGTARVGACVRLWLRAVELPLCGGAEAGGTRATGFGVRADLGTSDPWFALFVHGGLAIPLTPSLAVVGRIEGAVPLVYSEYVHGDVRLYRAWPVVLRGGLGLEFRWGQRNAGQPENPSSG